MRTVKRYCVCTIVCAAVVVCFGCAQERAPKGTAAVRLLDFGDPTLRLQLDSEAFRTRPAGVESMEIEFTGQDSEGLRLSPPLHYQRRDWRGWGQLVVDVENRSPRKVEFGVLIRAKEGSRVTGESAGFALPLEAGERVAWPIPLRHLPYTHSGYDWRIDGAKRFNGWGRTPLDDVREVRLCIWNEDNTGRVVLHALTLADKFEWRGWVDEFGQRADMTWPRKVSSVRDMKLADQREKRELEDARRFTDRDEYQAWVGGPTLQATGLFRVEKYKGRWWFVAPNGHLYFCTGMDCVLSWMSAPITEQTRPAYSWLPDAQSEFSSAWMTEEGVKMFSFYRANLRRKWGADFEKRFHQRAEARQLAWGFTSVGNWSDRAQLEARKLPYVTMGPGAWYEWAEMKPLPMVTEKIVDVWHADFEAAAHELARATLSMFKGDPWCIGHFIYNELDWPVFHKRVLALPADQAARKWVSGELQKRYGTIQRLNRAWGTTSADFDSLRWPYEKEVPPDVAADRDMREVRAAFAERWYRIWAEAVREACPGHLVLGSRINQGDSYPEVIEACARHCDVVSFNHYEHLPDRALFDRINARIDKPLFIGEYGHNSLDDGLLTMFVPVADQRERGVGFRSYTEQLAAMPYFVGCHFFQYLDEPITGRFDSETAFNGFVNVADIPSPYLVEAAQAVNRRIYQLHSGAVEPVSEEPRQ